MATQAYVEIMRAAILGIPDEHMPDLIEIVHAFRHSVELKSNGESVKALSSTDMGRPISHEDPATLNFDNTDCLDDA